MAKCIAVRAETRAMANKIRVSSVTLAIAMMSVALIGNRCYVESVQLLRYGIGWNIGSQPKFSGITRAQRHFHKIHPYGECGAGASFLRAQCFFLVVFHPHAAGEMRRETNELCIGEFIGRAGFPRKRKFHRSSGDSCPMQN